MTYFFLLCLIFAPFVFLLLAIRLSWRAVRALKRRRLPGPTHDSSLKAAIEVAAMSVIGAGLCWTAGVGSGFYLLDPDEICDRSRLSGSAAGSDVVTIEEHLSLPVRQTCVWADGTRYDLVPSWVNPMIAVFLVVLALSLVVCVAGLVTHRRRLRAVPE
ncbi:hypothetical protein Pmi06nite_45410 [Planotetraspora mira]|uniref:Transmembrane protein n=1 Tax=Planotetraspora mira TaxID=58121 RepID=A0A8J3X8N3_9ACTN|nr:hypothetical protein Pmi06nite_45410 [Planotetraspora mira]